MLKKTFNRWNKKIDGTGLAIFRITFFLILFLEVKQLYYFRKLVYGPWSSIVPSDIDLSYALWLWMAVCLMLVLGVFTRINTILSYVFSLVFIATINTYEYHMFYVYVGIGFLSMFMPLSRCLSLDRLILKIKYSVPNYLYTPPKLVSVWNYEMILLHGIAFVYFGSIFFKLNSHNWMTGIGMWLPASLPMNTNTDLSFMLNSEFGSLSLGYMTLIFEFVFIFLMWFKVFRWPLFLIGLGLHLGIVIAFPLPWFGLGEIAILLLLIPVSFWYKLWPQSNRTYFSLYYNINDTFDIKKITILKTLDIFSLVEWKINKQTSSSLNQREIEKQNKAYFKLNNATEVYIFKKLNLDQLQFFFKIGLFIFLLFLQLGTIYQTGLVKNKRIQLGIYDTTLDKVFSRPFYFYADEIQDLLGICTHPVFMDTHFNGYNHIVAITYIDDSENEIFLPIIDENGNPDKYNSGFNWVKWTFRVNSPLISQRNLEKGIRDFSAFWSEKNYINLNEGIPKRFNIKVKKIEIPQEWEYNFKQRMESTPWLDGGYVTWLNGEYKSFIKDIEKL